MGWFNKKHNAKANLDEIAIAQVQDKYSNYPSNGLTPYRLANIFKEADVGDVLRQMELFEEMEEKDPHLFSQLQTRKNAVTGLDYEVNAFSDEEQDEKIAEFVREELKSIESIDDLFMDLLDAIGKGVAFVEIIWAIEDGKTVVGDIRARPQKKFFWDQEDVLKVRTKEHPEGIKIVANKFITHRYKARSGHPSRAGILRVVAWMYLFKNYDVKDWVAFCEVFGMPLRLGKYQAGASEEDKGALMKALVQLGTDAAGIIPDNTDIEFKESAKTTSVNVYESLANFCDEQMSKAILGQTLTSDSGGGSFAQGKVHNEVRHDLTVADCKALAATLRRDLIRPLVLFNFGEEKRIPYLSFDCEETGDQKETVQIYDKLIDMGLKISTDHIYKKFRVPKPVEGEEVAKKSTMSEMQFKNEIEAKGYKSKGILQAEQKEASYQKEVDMLADKAASISGGLFTSMFEPLQKEIADAVSLAELKAKLDDPRYIEKLYGDMDEQDLERLLQKSMFFADLMGRVMENDR